MEMKQRMIPHAKGRTGIKLDEPTWTAVDWLASSGGSTWKQWCASIIDGLPKGENMAAALRAAAMDGLLAATIFEERGEHLAAMERHPLMRDSAILDDTTLEEVMTGATMQGWSDFGGFAIGFGHDEHGQECLWVRNGLRNHPHFALVLPQVGGDTK